jgi:hypothetical protein
VCRLAFPQDVTGKTIVYGDECITPLIQTLNDFGFHTVGVCCGHGKRPASIMFRVDGENVEIKAEIISGQQ